MAWIHYITHNRHQGSMYGQTGANLTPRHTQRKWQIQMFWSFGSCSPPPFFFHVQNISAMAGSCISIRHASCHVSMQSQIWLLNRPSESQAACRRRGPFVRISLALVGHSLQHLGLSGHYSPVTRVRLERQDISMCENPSKYNWIGITSCTSLFWIALLNYLVNMMTG